MKNKKTKWLYLAIGVVVVLVVGVAANSGLLGENLQGRLKISAPVKQVQKPVNSANIEILLPTNAQCDEMYNYLVSNGSQALSTWMIDKGYSAFQAQVCEGRDTANWYSANSRCGSIYNYLKAHGSTALSTWMSQQGYTYLYSQQCASSNPDWYTANRCGKMYNQLKIAGVSGLSRWMISYSYKGIHSAECATMYGDIWYRGESCKAIYDLVATTIKGTNLTSFLSQNGYTYGDYDFCKKPENYMN